VIRLNKNFWKKPCSNFKKITIKTRSTPFMVEDCNTFFPIYRSHKYIFLDYLYLLYLCYIRNLIGVHDFHTVLKFLIAIYFFTNANNSNFPNYLNLCLFLLSCFQITLSYFLFSQESYILIFIKQWSLSQSMIVYILFEKSLRYSDYYETHVYSPIAFLL